jgi:hypothetical protein
VDIVEEIDLAERGTPEFYQEQADRLKGLAASTSETTIRIELLEMAAVFQRMAERASIQKNWAGGIDANTA